MVYVVHVKISQCLKIPAEEFRGVKFSTAKQERAALIIFAPLENSFGDRLWVPRPEKKYYVSIAR